MKIELPEKLKPYSSIIYFAVLLMISHFLWKIFVLGDESDEVVSLFGMDISLPFTYMAQHIA